MDHLGRVTHNRYHTALDRRDEQLCKLQTRVARLEGTLKTVRQAIIDKADDTFWLSSIETVVDHIDEALGDIEPTPDLFATSASQ